MERNPFPPPKNPGYDSIPKRKYPQMVSTSQPTGPPGRGRAGHDTAVALSACAAENREVPRVRPIWLESFSWVPLSGVQVVSRIN